MATWDKESDKKIATLHPLIRNAAETAINELHDVRKMNVRVTFGRRTFKEQDDLYAIGRTVQKDKPKVTNAKGGESMHNYALALDVVEVSPQYGYGARYDETRWVIIAEVFKKHGFEWGGSWKTFKDKPHFQMTFGHTLAQLKQMYHDQESPEYLGIV